MGKRPAVAELGHPLGYLDLAPPPGWGGSHQPSATGFSEKQLPRLEKDFLLHPYLPPAQRRGLEPQQVEIRFQNQNREPKRRLERDRWAQGRLRLLTHGPKRLTRTLSTASAAGPPCSAARAGPRASV